MVNTNDLIRFPAVQTRTGFFRATLQFELTDAWIGVRWRRYQKAIDLFVCLIPCLRLNVYWQWGMR